MNLNKLTLTFSEENSYLEAKYKEHYSLRNKNHFRLSCLMSVFFFSSWIYFDIIFFGNYIGSFIQIKIILSILFLLGFLYTFSRQYKGYSHKFSLIYVLLVGLGYCIMICQVRTDILYPLVFGIAITYVFNYAFIRLRFLYSSLSGTGLLLCIYILLYLIRKDLGGQEKQVAVFFLLMMNTLGMIISYTIEYSYRSEFYFLHSLEQEKEKHISKIEMRLYQDESTGLYNRKALEFLESRVRYNNEEGIPSSLVFIDLDQLKYVNDNFGHDAGDLYISTLGVTILENLRAKDMAFRFGGDEFLIFLNDCGNSQKIMKRILMKYSEKISLEFKRFKGSFSFGIIDALENKEKDLDELISIADALMMENKRERKIRRGELNASDHQGF